eukprot:TRINITY_DN7904_c0_g1_i2.p1 TRINITY_DN7904_c0_g1~~TRINITY_DN7904_c0_g1_i2.p1  ORF type:complete len:109 (-),score=27.31 TRINITY_DN7904_c0_g1_i2:518-844(-)
MESPHSPIDVTLSYPTANGLTVNIVSTPACTHTPSALTFAPGATRQYFTAVCTNNYANASGATSYTYRVTPVISGQDALHTSSPAALQVTVNKKSFTVNGIDNVRHLG